MTQIDNLSHSPRINNKSKSGLIVQLLVILFVFLAVSIGAGTFLFFSPLGQVSMDMRVQSSSGGYSQLFFTDADESFIEERSEKELVRTGENFLRFAINPVRRTIGDQLRWDPLNTPSDMTLSEIYIQAGLSRIAVPFENIRPSIGMSSFSVSGEGLDFAVETNDSQTLLQIGLQGIYRDHARNLLIASILIGLGASISVFVVQVVARRRYTPEYLQSINKPLEDSSDAKAPWWVTALTAVLLAGIGFMLIWVSQMQ